MKRPKTTSKTQIIETNLGAIEYLLLGQGPTVLSLHGAFGGYDQGLLISSFLIEKGYSILAPSRSGYLKTPIETGKSLKEQAGGMNSLLKALKIEKATLLGYSAGTQIAAQFALEYPEKTSALILMCMADPNYKYFLQFLYKAFTSFDFIPNFFSSFIQKQLNANPKWISKLLLRIDNYLDKAVTTERIEFVNGNKEQLEFLQAFVKTFIPILPRTPGALNDLKHLSEWKNLPLDLITSPSFILEAIDDNLASSSIAKEAHDQIKGSKLVSVKKSGHFIFLGENTDSWKRELTDFLFHTHSCP